MREQAVPDIYLSDWRSTADNVQFTFGNADRVMTVLANDTDPKFAGIDLSLYPVNTGILLQLWSDHRVGREVIFRPDTGVDNSV